METSLYTFNILLLIFHLFASLMSNSLVQLNIIQNGI